MSTTARRRFLKSLAVAPLLPAAAQAPPAPAPAAEAPRPSPSPGAPTALALALAEAVRHRFGGAALTADDLAEVAKGIDGNLQAASRLRERLSQGNADEPVTLFEARPTPFQAPPPPLPARPRRRRTRR
jgi:hypothetical protein